MRTNIFQSGFFATAWQRRENIFEEILYNKQTKLLPATVENITFGFFCLNYKQQR